MQSTSSTATQLVGILNLTPDSFSDGGLYFSNKNAIRHLEKLVAEGADILDIGAESTRPGATPLVPEEEWERLRPIIDYLKLHPSPIPISLDTRNVATATKALESNAGIAWINDVSGFADPTMAALALRHKATLVVMHNLGVPADKNITLPEACNPVKEVLKWGKAKLAALMDAGISQSQIIFDPGIGFGKTAAQSLQIIDEISKFKVLGVPLLVGHSRKSFLDNFNNKEAKNREEKTHAISAYLAQQKVDYLRVHDIKGNKQAMLQHA